MSQVTDRPIRPGADAPVVHKPKTSLPWPLSFYQTAVGKKWVMALTGMGLIGFVLFHMYGNLKLYMGPHDIDHYSEGLRTLGYPIFPKGHLLWAARGGLITMFVLHIHSAFSLTQMNRAATPVNYKGSRDYVAVSFASRTMRYTGLIVLLYLIFHVLDLTLGKGGADFVHGNVRDNMIASMSRVPVAIAYIVANIAIAIHLFHGAWSMFQSIGAANPKYNQLRRIFAMAVAIIIGVGNSLFPLLIVTHVVK